jgi:hypothetical protein
MKKDTLTETIPKRKLILEKETVLRLTSDVPPDLPCTHDKEQPCPTFTHPPAHEAHGCPPPPPHTSHGHGCHQPKPPHPK